MPTGVFGKAQFNRGSKLLCSFIAVQVHVPASLNKPVFKLIEGNLPEKVAGKPFSNLVFSDHFSHILSLDYYEADYTV